MPMTLDVFVMLARKYRDLGDAVGTQIDHVTDGDANDANPNALRRIDRWLADVQAEADPESALAWDVEEARRTIAGATGDAPWWDR